jgi:hypothetical protein
LNTLNEVFSSLSARRRYEVWFVRLGLADGSGAWWFRYLLMNPGRNGCVGNRMGKPVQVWATRFPAEGPPKSFIQGFSVEELKISGRGQAPFHFQVGENRIGENCCRGMLQVDGHAVSWDLRLRSNFHATLSNKGWIGFSRTPHSDAVFSGQVELDGETFFGDPLGFGVQGHNCGYRHRTFWVWTHAYFPRTRGPASTLEALVYDMPFGLVFRKAALWHEGKAYLFRNLEEINTSSETMQWSFCCIAKDGLRLQATVDGSGPSLHRLAYVKTDCSASFEVRNNSLSSASILIEQTAKPAERLETRMGAVIEMAGGYSGV